MRRMKMNRMSNLKDLQVNILSGQIMSRITAKPDKDDDIMEIRRVIVPKAILSDGTIDVSELPEENLKVPADEKRLTKPGDIVIKLSTPYDAAIIDEASAGCIVPSFCAIVRVGDNFDVNYLLAFLNSSLCKEQLKQQVAGMPITVLSVGKVASVVIPVPSIEEQREIGTNYIKTQQKIKVVQQIVELEAKRNDVVFKEMVKKYD